MISYSGSQKFAKREENAMLKEEKLRAIARKRAQEMRDNDLRPWLAKYETHKNVPYEDLEQYRKMLGAALQRLWDN